MAEALGGATWRSDASGRKRQSLNRRGRRGLRLVLAKRADRVLGLVVAADFAVAVEGTPAVAVANDAERGFRRGKDILREHGKTPFVTRLFSPAVRDRFVMPRRRRRAPPRRYVSSFTFPGGAGKSGRRLSE